MFAFFGDIISPRPPPPMVWCYFGFARTESPPFVPFLVYEFQVGFYPRRSEVWEWGFRNCIFDTCSFPCNRISMNFPYLCIYRSSEGASLMVWPKCWESNHRSGPTGTEWDTPTLSENKDSESGGGDSCTILEETNAFHTNGNPEQGSRI